MLVTLVLLGPALVFGILFALAVRRHPGIDPASPRAASAVAHELEQKEQRSRFTWPSRMDPKTETGLLLVLALVVIVVGGRRARRARIPRALQLRSPQRRPVGCAVGRGAHDRLRAVDARLRDVVRQHRCHRRVHRRRVRRGDDPAPEPVAPGVPDRGDDRTDPDEHAASRSSSTASGRPPTRSRTRSGRRSRAVTPPVPRHASPRSRSCSGAADRATCSRCWRARPCSSRSRWRRRACCSACTGSPT